jgi:hypothetical protein
MISFADGYSSSDVLYHWRGDTPVGLEEGVNLAQYDLTETKTETLQGSPEQAMMRRGTYSYYFQCIHKKQ